LRDLGDIAAGRGDSAERLAFAGSDVVSPTTGADHATSPPEALESIRPYLITRVSLRGA
jgi:hypothetical protein